MSLLSRMPPFMVRQGIEWRRDALAGDPEPAVREMLAADLALLEGMVAA